jgi:Ca2+/Na+ antiporter
MKSLFSKILRQPTQSLRGAQPAPTQTTFVLPVILLMLAAPTIRQMEPSAALWATPAILMAAMVIAWAAESAQFFIAQGFALAILAWLQTLPEFAVEAVLAWRQRTDLLMANLTGSLRLLTGLGWPMIYFVAAACHRARRKKPLRSIPLADEHCVEVVGLLAALLYSMVIYAKGSLTVWDGLVLILIYAVYLMILGRMPPQEAEGIEDLELIPRTIVKSRRPIRIALIFGLFLIGGLLIYFMAEPFLGSLLSVSIMLGVQPFVFVQWVAPFVSEFPEKVSAFYWARSIHGADEHGFKQYQPVDPARRHATHGVFVELRDAHADRLRRSAETGIADDHRSITGRHDVPHQHAPGLVGGGGVVQPVGYSIRAFADPTRSRHDSHTCRSYPLVRDHRVFHLVRDRHSALSGRSAKVDGIPSVWLHVA